MDYDRYDRSDVGVDVKPEKDYIVDLSLVSHILATP